jgi:hypothetical protein
MSNSPPPAVLNAGNKVQVNFDWFPTSGSSGGGYWTGLTGRVSQVDPNGQWITMVVEGSTSNELAYIEMRNVKWMTLFGQNVK